MADIDLKTSTPDTTLPTTGFLFGADSQAASAPSVYSPQTVATTLLGSTSLTGATITTSQPVLDLSQTWNAGAVTFTGLRFNAATGSNVNSAAGSLLMDLQLEGSSKFSVRKDGRIVSPLIGNDYSLNASVFFTGSNIQLYNSGGQTVNISSSVFSLQAGIGFNWNSDTILTRRAAANLRLGAADAAAPVAQTLSVQSVVAGTSNTAGANLTITGSQGTGTGAGGSIIFQVAPAGSSGTAQNALSDAVRIQTTPNTTSLVIRQASGDGVSEVSSLLFVNAANTINGGILSSNQTGEIRFGGFRSGGFFPTFYLNNAEVARFRTGTSPVEFSLGTGALAFGSNFSGAQDVILTRDAANTLALRNGTNAQTFNVYNTFTSSTNFERFRIFAQSAAAVLIGTQKGSGGGTARALELQTDATSRLTLDTVGSAQIVTALTVATLPATPLTGMIARVTDALAPAVGVTVAAGGAAQALCWYNGANWTVIGV